MVRFHPYTVTLSSTVGFSARSLWPSLASLPGPSDLIWLPKGSLWLSLASLHCHSGLLWALCTVPLAFSDCPSQSPYCPSGLL